MGKSGYTSLSLDENRYAKLRKNWDKIVSGTEDWGTSNKYSFTAWATIVLEQAIERTSLIGSMFPNLTWVGKTDTGCVIKDKNIIVEVKWNKNKLVCSVDKDLCNHCIFAALNAKF
jgi:hypothetical protein|tara:strand:+ start:123 stop:470 length:348 start_codon:yes stop_codon:yes gene_type:complete